MKFIAVEKHVSIVFRHIMFCVTQAEISLKKIQNICYKIFEFKYRII